MTKRTVLNYGTFDVDNYGDLLFPHLVANEMSVSSTTEVQSVSPVGRISGTIRNCAPVLGIEDVFYSEKSIQGAIIGGGNIIHCSPTKIEYYQKSSRENLAYGDLWIAPTFFLPSHIPIVWNAPGVPGPFYKSQHDLVKSALSRTNYISVRDPMSRNYLLDVWPDADISIVPDSAWILNSLWSHDQLKSIYTQVFEKYGITKPERSVVFHLNRRYLGGKSLKSLAHSLDNLAKTFSARPILIAFASCHGDDILAKEVGLMMTSDPVILDRSESLIQIASCIAHSHAYIGSSMHGLITASSYRVPGICIAKQTMPKFAGLSLLTGIDNLVIEDWDLANEILTHLDFQQRRKELAIICDRTRSALANHWEKIREILFSANGYSNSYEKQFDNRRYSEYQNQAFNALSIKLNEEHNAIIKGISEDFDIVKKQLEKDKKELRKEIRGLKRVSESDVKCLQAQIKTMNRSISWRMTRPLRAASKRFPHTGAKVVGLLQKTSEIIRRSMPSLDSQSSPLKQSWTIEDSLLEDINNYQKTSIDNKKRRIVFYTAIFGKYDNLLLPEKINDDVDYICYTDQPRKDYGVWQLRNSPYHHTDPTRIARYIKMHPHELFPEYDWAIWLDANIRLRESVHKYIDILKIDGSNFGLIPHPHRSCFYQEAKACKHLRKDSADVIDLQVAFYRENGLQEYQGLFETGFMVIRLTDSSIADLFRSWWQQIQKFSRRDQLGLSWSLKHSKISPSHLLPKGTSVREDEDFTYFTHDQCKHIQAPENLQKIGEVADPFEGTSFATFKHERLSKIETTPIDIIVCVFNALEDVKLNLESCRRHLLSSHKIIIVNDCSDDPTTEYLRKFACDDCQVILYENEENLGYTQTANKGLSAGTADFKILLNSDTIVCENWALKLLDVALQHPKIGIVGPLSNAAGVQSVPQTKGGKNNTVINEIPDGMDISEIDLFLEKVSNVDGITELPLIHGFCFGIKKSVIDTIGFFDVDNFSRYYGEENDYCFRAAEAGYSFACATNTFVYHRKSRSIEDEERVIHMEKAGQQLRKIYGIDALRTACLQGEDHPNLKRMREHVSQYFAEFNDKSR